jgi:hypothetical protein
MANQLLTNLFEGSPILIGGGGSVNLNFDDQAYLPVHGSPGTFVRDDDELIALYIVDLRGIPIGADLTQYVEDQDCVITIKTFNDKGVRSDIVVSSRPETDTPGEIDIVFNPGVFPAVDHRNHHSDHNKVGPSITIHNNDSGETVEPPSAADGRCIITFVNKRKEPVE